MQHKSVPAITLHAHALTIHRIVVIVHGWKYQCVTIIPEWSLHCIVWTLKKKCRLLAWSTQKMNALVYSFLISETMWNTSWYWQNLQNISQTNPLCITGMLRYCSVSSKKWVELCMRHNLSGLVWRQCGRIWKIGPPLWWKMRTIPHITYPQYLHRFAKCWNAWNTPFTNYVSFLITLFYFRSTHFFLVFSHMQIEELTFAALCI